MKNRTESVPPLLSICIPTYNRAELLRGLLEDLAGIADQLDFEVVVSDNCSTDHTQQVLESFVERIPLHYVKQPETLAMELNFSAVSLLARGKYLFWFGDDDRIIPNAFADALELLESDPDAVAAYGNYNSWNPESDEVAESQPYSDSLTCYTKQDPFGIINNHYVLECPIVKTEVFQRFCSHIGQGWQMIATLLQHGSIYVLPYCTWNHAVWYNQSQVTQEMSEPWFHDHVRSDFEAFFGLIRTGEPDSVARFLAQRPANTYSLGIDFSLTKKRYLDARIYMLRLRSLNMVDDEAMKEFESKYLYHMAAEKLKSTTSNIQQIKKIFCEECEPLREFAPLLLKVMPQQIEIVFLSSEDLLKQAIKQDTFMLVESFELLAARNKTMDFLPSHQRAFSDLVYSCRLLR